MAVTATSVVYALCNIVKITLLGPLAKGAFHSNFSPRGQMHYKLCVYFSLVQWNQAVISRVTNLLQNLMEFIKLSSKRVGDHISQLSEQLLRVRPRGKHIAQLLDIKDYPDQIAILVKAKSNLWTPQLEAMFCMRNSQIQPFLLFSFIFPQNNPI